MKAFFSIIVSGILFFQISVLASNDKQNNYSIIEVISPAKEVYNDGIYRIQFSSFYVIDEEGNKIISSGEVFDYAAKIKLSEGIYKIFYKNADGTLSQKELLVDKGNYIQIKLD
jgi:hypothetical protein